MEKTLNIKRIAMLSTHGYVDPVPQLGRTDTGGQVVYVLELAQALTKRGVGVDIFTRWFDRERRQVDPLPDCTEVRVIRIPSGPWEFIPKEQIYDVLPELASNMVSFVREQGLDYDLYHGHYVDAGIVTLDVVKELGRPAFFTAHSLGAWKREQMCGDPEEMEKQYNYTHRIAEEKRIFESVVAQSVTTELQHEKLDTLYGYTGENVEVIPPGVDVHTFHPAAPGEAKPDWLGDRYIFCLSRIDCNKGHDLLLEAFDLVRREVPDVRLVIGGGSKDPQERELEVLSLMRGIIESHGMGERVDIIGYVPDERLVHYYRHAELFVLPSIFEPFGMTAIEAMACGTPVVASKFGGIRNVIITGDNGLLVDPQDETEFADAISKLLADKGLRDRYGQAGCETVRQKFSWEAIADRHIDFYSRFLGT
ncbi:MAG: glycosyltransferase [bacterium]|nr:MAG: glycosyltransferase [bacterium]